MNEPEIVNPWPGHCFGCSPRNPHGLQLRFWRSESGCSTRCIVPDRLCGWDGWVHGGIIAALLDEVAAWSIVVLLRRLGITGKLTIRYVKPVPTNTELDVRGQVRQHNPRFAEVYSAIRSPDGVLLAEGESKWLLPKIAELVQITGLDEATLRQFFAQISPDQDAGSD